jgi:hypothetical protein
MSVVVVRSRPHNAGERPRRASPSGIVRQPEPGGKHICAMSRGALGGTEEGSGGRTRTPGGSASRRVRERRAHRGAGAPVLGRGGPDAAGLERPSRGGGAPGGPRGAHHKNWGMLIV